MGTPATLGQAAHILTLIGQKNVDKDDLTALVQSGLLADLLIAPDVRSINRDEFRKLIGLKPLVPDRIILSIDYSTPFGQRVAAGNYDWKNDDLTEDRFPIDGEGIEEYEFRYIHTNRDVSSKTAVDLIRKEDCQNPWEPARTEHLLAYGENFPEEQLKWPILATGSVGKVRDICFVPCLEGDGSKRGLDLRLPIR